MAKQRLTDRALTNSVSLQDLIHIVKTGDTTQSPSGSSFKATVQSVVNTLSASTVTGLTFNNFTYDLTLSLDNGNTFTDNLGILASDIKVTGGTYNSSTGDITFTNNSGGTFVVTGVIFTGNTSASCITDLYISNLYGCSPIVVHDNLELVNGVYLKDQSGLSTIDISSGSYNQYIFGTGNNQTNIYQDNTGVELYATYNGYVNNNIGTVGISVVRNGGGNWSNPVLIQGNYDNNVYHNISPYHAAIFINSVNSATLSGITGTVILGGENMTATTSNTTYVDNLNIKTIGSGTSVINLGLDVNGNVVTGATTPPFSGGSGNCITDLYISNLYGCSPITIHDSIKSPTSIATGVTSFAFGFTTNAIGPYSTASGAYTTASGPISRASGLGTTASGTGANSEGSNTIASGDYSHTEGESTVATLTGSHAEGYQTSATTNYAHAEGTGTLASGQSSHAEGAFTTASGLYSHSEGFGTTASGNYSHAEGVQTTASGYGAHAEGIASIASGSHSHAEGNGTLASGQSSHAEGNSTTALGTGSHAEGFLTSGTSKFSHSEGFGTTASGDYSHAEGVQTTASGYGAHAEGAFTTASGLYSHSEGNGTLASGQSSHAEGNSTTALGTGSHAEGYGTTASNTYSHAEGVQTTASGYGAHAEGYAGKTGLFATGNYSHAEGAGTNASGLGAHAEGRETTASGAYSHSEGSNTVASGSYSHAEGYQTLASQDASHAEGYQTSATTQYAHAEGAFTTASGLYSHSEGFQTTASGQGAHAEGQGTTASNTYSHAEGQATNASGYASHAEGYGSIASGDASHSEGGETTASANYAHAEGFQTSATTQYAHSEGVFTLASGQGSHAEGFLTFATNSYSHAEGRGTTASGQYAHSQGSGTTASGFASFASGINSVAATTGTFIHSKNSIVTGQRSVVLGGQNITGSTDDTVYTPYLNIGNIATGTSVINLGLDINGNVVTGTSGGGGTFTGNTSATCITDIYTTNIYGCSPLHIEPSGLNDVYITENGGNVGIGTTTPNYKLDVVGETRLSGAGQNILTIIGSGDTTPLFTVQGSSGELFTVTDSLVGSLFSVNNISGLPILEVFDDDTILMGSYQSPSLNSSIKINPTIGLNTVYSLPMSAYTGAWFEYTVINSSMGLNGARAGQIMSIFSGNTVNFTETTTTDIGSTTPITFNMVADGTTASLEVSATTIGWEVKTIVRSI